MRCQVPPGNLWARLQPAGNGHISAHRAVVPSLRGHVAELSAPLARPLEVVEVPANDRAVSPQPTTIACSEGNGSEPTRNRRFARGFVRGAAGVGGFFGPTRCPGLARGFVSGAAAAAVGGFLGPTRCRGPRPASSAELPLLPSGISSPPGQAITAMATAKAAATSLSNIGARAARRCCRPDAGYQVGSGGLLPAAVLEGPSRCSTKAISQ